MSEFDIRGGCESQSLRLYGKFTGFNTGATMQVGLWITNDGEHIDAARAAARKGVYRLRDFLTGLMALNVPHSPAAHQAGEAAARSEGGWASIDWAQICYNLIGEEPDQDDLDRAGEEIEERDGYVPDTDEVYRHAQQWRELWASETALGFGGQR